MGKRKLDIENGDRPVNLDVAFSKRKKHIFKKAAELSAQTGAEIAIVAFSTRGNPFVFGHPSANSVIDRYMGCVRDENIDDFNFLYEQIQENDMSLEELFRVRDQLTMLVNEKLEKSQFSCRDQDSGFNNGINVTSSSGSNDHENLENLEKINFFYQNQESGFNNGVNVASSSGSNDHYKLENLENSNFFYQDQDRSINRNGVSEEITIPVLDYHTGSDITPASYYHTGSDTTPITTTTTDAIIVDSKLLDTDGGEDDRSLETSRTVTKSDETVQNLGTEKDTFLCDNDFWYGLGSIDCAKDDRLAADPEFVNWF